MKAKSAISQILKRLMFERDLKTAELARMMGMPQPTLHRIVEGTSSRPHMPSLVQIANHFGLTLKQLHGQDPIPWLTPIDLDVGTSNWEKVPLLEWHELSLLNNKNKEDQLILKPIVISDATFVGRSFAIRMPDSSMDPQFPVNTTLIFDEERAVKDRGFALIHRQSEQRFVFRQLIFDGMQMFIRPLSQDLRDLTLQPLDDNDVICGMLVQTKQDY